MANLLFLASQVLAALGASGVLGPGGSAIALSGGSGFGDFTFGGDGGKRRRRRRRALTASDKADIAFISGTLGKPAGRDFAMVVAARS